MKTSSKQPRKQRFARFNAGMHQKSKFLSGNLSKILRTQYKTRSIKIRRGDKVKIMRGKFKNKEGKVDRVSVDSIKIFIANLEIPKKDGSKALMPIDPSNVMITELDTTDKRRLKKFKVKKEEKPEVKK